MKNRIKQLFCRHKNIEYKQPVSKFHALNTATVCTFCADCGKLLKTEYIDINEFYMRFNTGETE